MLEHLCQVRVSLPLHYSYPERSELRENEGSDVKL